MLLLFLCFNMFGSLVFWQEPTLLSDQLDEAINYTKTLQEKLEKMKERKESLMGIDKMSESTNKGTTIDLKSPHIEIQVLGSALVVHLVSGLDNQFMFYKSICILEEEGAEVVNASFSTMGDKVFHTIHSKVTASLPCFYF